MKPPFPAGTIWSFAPETSHFYLSNFYGCSVSYEGITYPTAEHAYQAAKVTDTDTRMSIMRCGNAAGAKKCGQGVKLRLDWEAIKVDVMREILREKFRPGSDLHNRLVATTHVELIEGNYWHDKFWGQCYCRRHHWEGVNQLGKLLMELRSGQ